MDVGDTYLPHNIKNYGFIAQLTILFVLPHHRNHRYGNEYYDKTYSYEIFDREQEFEKLEEIEELSHEVAQFTIIQWVKHTCRTMPMRNGHT